MTPCSICGGRTFGADKVLWSALVDEWELLPEEVEYIDQQQGTHCLECRASLRIMVLGQAIQDALHSALPLRDYGGAATSKIKVLDINGCDALSAALQQMPGYVRANFPEIDMCALPFPERSFDLVVHSDTLEHVPNPLLGLEECSRVLKPGGRLCFTVPIIVGRMTRDRANLPKSYHGDPQLEADDYVVHTEFGADAWTLPMRAGFDNVAVKQIEHPAAHAITAWRGPLVESPRRTPPSAAFRRLAKLISSAFTWRRERHAEAIAVPLDRDALRENHPEAEAMAQAQDEAGEKGGDAEATTYDQDGLRSVHNHDFMSEPGFVRAYQRGVRAVGTDYHWHWRVHVGLWAARMAARLPGDFVECGTNKGFLSSAIMQDLEWSKTGRRFYLLDTFSGLDERYVSADEKRDGVLDRNRRELESGFYTTNVEAVRANFAEWGNVCMIVGAIPETLAQVDAQRIAFLHIDLNCSPPEVAAIRHLWDRLTPGAPVLLDDYAYIGYEWQKVGMDGFAAEHGLSILSLPTGQGLLIKPP